MKSFSELTSASQVNNEDLLAISQTSGSGYASKKTTVKDITDKSNLNLAEEYDSTSTYAVDDYVIYESVLYKCIASTTGTFDSTKWTSVVVTDEMGSGGGGGTGGHTIIDENGNSMTARAGLQFVGGANVSDDATNNKTIVDLASAGGIDGVFIDTDNVIVPTSVLSQSTVTYTATEDCIMWVYLVANRSTASVSIDGDYVFNFYNGATSNIGQAGLIPIKKGQVATIQVADTTNSQYAVYGIQTGTTHSKFQPVIYSLEEREIGVWKDGKPLYQKSFEINVQNAQTGSWSQTSIQSDNIENIIAHSFTNSSGNELSGINIANLNSYINIMNLRNSSQNYVGYLTLQYTKTTDVAGSGSWTPQGVPTHHYSMDEQVIGTWIDGSTLYEKTVDVGQYNVTLVNNAWNNVFALSNVDYLAQAIIHKNSPNTNHGLRFQANNGYIQGASSQQVTLSSLGTFYVTFQYTKTS